MYTSQVSVLVVGAGPAGLVAALNLAKNGVGVRIIDKVSKFQVGSRGGGVQPRSLELFHFLGVLPEMLKRGLALMPHRVYKLPGGTEVLEEGWMTPPAEPTPFTPYNNIFLVSQMNIEDILRGHLAEFGVHVELATELRAFEQDESHVTAHLIKHDDGEEREVTISCDYLIGTDGGRGITRKLLGLNFLGVSREDAGAVVGEIEVEGLAADHWHMWGGMGTKMLMLRPTEFPGVFYLGAAGQVDYDLIQKDRDALVEFMYEASDRRDLKFGALTWIGSFRPHVRMVDTFGKGRVFVAGDAAHVHSPAGGQGLNSSVQDSFNLTWKLALVIKGISPPSLLSTYDAERSPVIREMLGYTLELLEKVKRTSVDVPGSNSAAWARGRELMQLGVNYRWSEIVKDDRAPHRSVEELQAAAYGGAGADTETVQAGDRSRDAPDLRVLAEGEVRSTTLFDIFGPTHHTVLVFAGSTRAEEVESTVRTLAAYPADLVHTVVVYPRGAQPKVDAARGVLSVVDDKGYAYQGYSFDEAHTDNDKLAIMAVRPDAVVGAVVFGLNSIKQHFSKIFKEEAVKNL